MLRSDVRTEFAQRSQIDAQARGDDFEEPSASRRATVVHGEIPNAAAVLQADDFAVLPADFDDRPRDRNQVMNAARVARDRRAGEPHRAASISRRDDGGDVQALKLGFLQGFLEQFGGQALLVRPLIRESASGP